MIQPKGETALFFKTVDDWICNFELEISQHLQEYYDGPFDEKQLAELSQLAMPIDPLIKKYLRTESTAWSIGWSRSASKPISRQTAVKEGDPCLL